MKAPDEHRAVKHNHRGIVYNTSTVIPCVRDSVLKCLVMAETFGWWARSCHVNVIEFIIIRQVQVSLHDNRGVGQIGILEFLRFITQAKVGLRRIIETGCFCPRWRSFSSFQKVNLSSDVTPSNQRIPATDCCDLNIHAANSFDVGLFVFTVASSKLYKLPS